VAESISYYGDVEGTDPITPLIRKVPVCYGEWVEEARRLSSRRTSQSQGDVRYQSGGDTVDRTKKEIARIIQSRFFRYLAQLIEEEVYG